MTYAQMIGPFLWTVAGVTVTAFVVGAFRARRRGASMRKLLIRAAIVAGAAFLVVPAIGVVPAGHRGVVYEWSGGIDPGERNEGVTLLIPWVQHMQNISVRTQALVVAKLFAQSSDLQEITAPVSVNYHIDPTQAAELYQGIGPEYRETVILRALFERSKEAIGQVKAEDFAKRRQELASTIRESMSEQLDGYGIVIEYVNIEDAIFDPAFVKAVKNKVIAEQEAARQRNLVLARKAIKEQTIINAEATGRSIKIRADAQAKANVKIARSVTPALIRWQWLVRWNGILPTTLVGGEDVPLILGLGGATSYSYP